MLVIGFAVCALLFGTLVYRRWSIWTNARQTFEQAAAERNRLTALDPFPNEVNSRKLQEYLGKYTSALNEFKAALAKEVAPAPPLAPNEFQSRLRQAVVAALDRARTNNVKLPERFQLGFDEFTRTMPSTAVTPLLGQELSQIQMLINIVLDAKVDSVTSLRRTPLPEEGGTALTPTPPPTVGLRAPAAKPGGTPAPILVERNLVDLSFKAAPATARKALNEIAASTRQFFVIHALRAQRKRQRPLAGEDRKSNAGPKRASASGCSGRPELHRWQRAHRSLRYHRNAAVYVLTTNGHE